jgi:phosphate-selective porin
MVLNKFIKAACLSACLGLASGSILADVNVESNGGLRVYDSNDNNHWFELTGQMQLDQQFQMGGEGNTLTSTFNLSTLRTDLKGGIGQDTVYSFRLQNTDNGAEFTKAKITYSGFNSWSRVTVGQVSMPYGFDSGSSFLADNMVLSAMKPSGALGVTVDTWNDKLGFSCGLNQPANASSMSDFNTSARLSFAPVSRDNLVVHLGLSGSYKKTQNNISVDAAVLRGPVFLQAEYHRSQTSGDTKNTQQGWSVEGSYALTGESRDYDYRKGSFSSLRTDRDNGSWELSIRGSQLDSNQQLGGSVAWTVNNNLKLLANYMHAVKSNNGDLSLRLQAAW